MIVSQNSDFLLGFQATLSNPNGDPDQENKPRMDYETNTVLVSDNRRKRDVRDFLKNHGYNIFVDTLSDQKVPMQTMFEHIRDKWLKNNEKIQELFHNTPDLQVQWKNLFVKEGDYLNTYLEKAKNLKGANEKKEFTKFNNLFLTNIIMKELIDIRLFGSAMAVEGVSKTYTGPVQISWGYSLHPVELVKSSTITSIMNEDSSTFGKKFKLYYALIAHYGTINKYNAKLTGMSEKDRTLFRQALVQSMMANKTDSKQGQEPLFYLEIVYKPDFDGYLGDLRRFIDVTYKEDGIRGNKDITLDFTRLNDAIGYMEKKGYVDKAIVWEYPFLKQKHFIDIDCCKKIDLWSPIKTEE